MVENLGSIAPAIAPALADEATARDDGAIVFILGGSTNLDVGTRVDDTEPKLVDLEGANGTVTF